MTRDERRDSIGMKSRVRYGAATAAGMLVALLGGCMVGPDYVRPKAIEPPAYKETGTWKVAQPAAELPRGAWWDIFGDRQLDELIRRIDISNQNLRAAEAQFRQAVAVAEQTRASLFPSLSATASVSRARSSALSPAAQAPAPFNTYTASAAANWTVDVWGSIRRTLEANESNAQASAATLASARLSAQALLATDYFALRIADAQKGVLEQTVKAYQTSYDLTVNRYKSGVAAKSDVVQAQTQLVSTQAALIDVGVQRAQLEHAIATLVGVPPSELTIPSEPLAAALPDVPLAIPSALLERRPDIAVAERQVQAANAQIGVATAAFFPVLSIAGSGGFRSFVFPRLFNIPNRFWSIGPSLSETLLDFGARSAVKSQAIAAHESAVANYRQVVLAAFQQVEDNLAALRILEEEARVQEEAVRLARESVNLTLNQYKAGTVNYLNVITVQATELSNESTAIALLGRRLAASVNLVQAMGGGWAADQIPAGLGGLERLAEDLKASGSVPAAAPAGPAAYAAPPPDPAAGVPIAPR